jgi:hypothetical protein
VAGVIGGGQDARERLYSPFVQQYLMFVQNIFSIFFLSKTPGSASLPLPPAANTILFWTVLIFLIFLIFSLWARHPGAPLFALPPTVPNGCFQIFYLYLMFLFSIFQQQYLGGAKEARGQQVCVDEAEELTLVVAYDRCFNGREH